MAELVWRVTWGSGVAYPDITRSFDTVKVLPGSFDGPRVGVVLAGWAWGSRATVAIFSTPPGVEASDSACVMHVY